IGVCLAAAFAPGASADTADGVAIHAIQGAAHVSPLVGRQVSGVAGVVTATSGTGFWMQDPNPDDDPATSEAIFVYTKTKPAVAVGDAVTVAGTVTEYRPSDLNGPNLSTTELGSPRVTVASHGNPLPSATVIGADGRRPPTRVIDEGTGGDVETGGTFRPDRDGIDFYESLEGMRVELREAVAVGPTNTYGETAVIGDGGRGASVRSARGGIVMRADDANPERLTIAKGMAAVPSADTGDTYDQVTGVLDYAFGNFELLADRTPAVRDAGLKPETTRAPRAGELAFATFNVENLSPKDPQAKFDRLAAQVVGNLRAPDLLSIEEIQDNDGATDDGVVAADQTVAKLTAAIRAAGGPSYAWRSIDPVNDADGGEPGGNIRVGFLYRTDRGLHFVDRPGGGATTPVSVTGRGPSTALSASPGRVDPANTAWTDSRKPLAGEFTWRGRKLFVIANHWNSKGGDDPLFGRYQPPRLVSETQRLAQSATEAAFVTTLRKADPTARVIVAGDLNDFDFSPPVKHFTSATHLLDLPATLPLPERYTYDYQGNSEVLDHILISPTLALAPHSYDVVHVNAEFAAQTSDHDPSVLRIR
ncbi:MAG TPA: endonuclease/exonuclease/phosphatase family protein, partial [Streptosporangiaceae bacterium]